MGGNQEYGLGQFKCRCPDWQEDIKGERHPKVLRLNDHREERRLSTGAHPTLRSWKDEEEPAEEGELSWKPKEERVQMKGLSTADRLHMRCKTDHWMQQHGGH